MTSAATRGNPVISNMTPAESSLVEAARCGRTDDVAARIAAGVNVHVVNEIAMRWAVTEGHADTLRVLLAAGADPNVNNGTVLYRAARAGRPDLIRLLLAAGADVHAQNNTALRQAAIRGHADVVRILLTAGADPVAAWVKSTATLRHTDEMIVTLEACADAMSSEQRMALAAKSEQFASLRSMIRSDRRGRHLRR